MEHSELTGDAGEASLGESSASVGSAVADGGGAGLVDEATGQDALVDQENVPCEPADSEKSHKRVRHRNRKKKEESQNKPEVPNAPNTDEAAVHSGEKGHVSDPAGSAPGGKSENKKRHRQRHHKHKDSTGSYENVGQDSGACPVEQYNQSPRNRPQINSRQHPHQHHGQTPPQGYNSGPQWRMGYDGSMYANTFPHPQAFPYPQRGSPGHFSPQQNSHWQPGSCRNASPCDSPQRPQEQLTWQQELLLQRILPSPSQPKSDICCSERYKSDKERGSSSCNARSLLHSPQCGPACNSDRSYKVFQFPLQPVTNHSMAYPPTNMVFQNHGGSPHGNRIPPQMLEQHHLSSNNQNRGNARSANRGGKRGQGQNQGGRGGQKRNQFEPYWNSDDVAAGLKRNELIEGALRINPKRFEDSYIPHPDGKSDIYISGLRPRNRALNGDVVVIQLLTRDKWKVLTDDVPGETQNLVAGFKGETTDSQNPATPTKNTPQGPRGATPKNTPSSGKQNRVNTPGKTENQTPMKRYMSLRDYISTPGDSPANRSNARDREEREKSEAEEEEERKRMDLIPDSCLLRTGKVVYIIERKHSRACTGNIRLMQDRNPDLALFAPIDHRLPRIMIPMKDCPEGFKERPDDFKTTLYIARITDWSETSMFPFGTLARSLGEAGEIEPETEGILIENGVDYEEFPEGALACLPSDLPWHIPQEEFGYRKDLRKQCIFTIDPATARDLDDALSCTPLGDGIYEVGVHIADVSFFVEQGNLLDHVARQRATSVYLVQKVIPMLPRLLCEKLCSLNPDEDRLTFSVIWKITEEGEIIDEWFGRSVIRSCVKLAYEHAQGFIEDPDKVWTPEELPAISEGYTIQQIQNIVLSLDKLAKVLRKKRFDGGALHLNQVKLQYALDKTTGLPCGYYVYQQKDSNKLVEEFMLLANMAVAHKIYKTYSDVALLRRHPPPQVKMIDDLVQRCHSLGVPIDASSSGSLQRSISQYCGDSLEEKARVQIIIALCTNPMQEARYFCTGALDDEEMFRHYALSVPLYTHFTSPIRRYPDLMVHRLLGASLGYSALPALGTEDVHRQASHCNDKKKSSKRVQELSSDLYFSVFVKECGPLEERGMVMGVLDKAFDVLVLKLGVVKRVYCERLPLEDFKFSVDKKKPTLSLTWKTGDGHPQPVHQSVTVFTTVNCILEADDQPLKWNAVIKHPEDLVCDQNISPPEDAYPDSRCEDLEEAFL